MVRLFQRAGHFRPSCRSRLPPFDLHVEQVISREASMLQNAPMYSYIPPKHIARALKFYEATLDFKSKEVTAVGVVYEFAQATACFLYPTPNAGTSMASQAFWQVEDIEQEVAELVARGVKFEKYDMPGVDEKGISTAGGARAAWFKDPEGNIMAIIQNL